MLIAFISDMAGLLVSFGKPFVSFETALSEGRSDRRKEGPVDCPEVVLHSYYLTASAAGVEGLVLFSPR